ncbi:unnamed protein product [Arabidopsis halleri]
MIQEDQTSRIIPLRKDHSKKFVCFLQLCSLISRKQRYVVNGVFYMTCSQISPTTRYHIISCPFISQGTPLTTGPTCQNWLVVIKFGGNSIVVKIVASQLSRLAESRFTWKVRLLRELRAVSTHERGIGLEFAT